MTENAHELAQAIKISARVRELKRMAEDTSEAYRRALIASGLPEQHFRLRAMLLSRLRPPGKGA
jgi:hypothetical protein